jgi:hypothetical protein
MRTFKDNAGRDWTVAVTVDAIKRVRTLAGVDLLEVVEGKLMERLVTDPVLLCDVIYSVCKPEADAKSVADRQRHVCVQESAGHGPQRSFINRTRAAGPVHLLCGPPQAEIFRDTMEPVLGFTKGDQTISRPLRTRRAN